MSHCAAMYKKRPFGRFLIIITIYQQIANSTADYARTANNGPHVYAQ